MEEVVGLEEVNDSGADLYISPTGGLCVPAGKHAGILTFFKHK